MRRWSARGREGLAAYLCSLDDETVLRRTHVMLATGVVMPLLNLLELPQRGLGPIVLVLVPEPLDAFNVQGPLQAPQPPSRVCSPVGDAQRPPQAPARAATGGDPR